MAVSKRLRFEILRRDGHRCHYCGATAVEAALTVDHVTATALGGTDTPDNLVTACDPCNSGKSATPPGAALVAGVQERHQGWRDALTATAEDDRGQQEFARAFLDAWEDGNGSELPPGWKRTIDAYRQSGLTPHMWAEIIDIALTKPNVEDRFRYCCGVARNKVKEIQERAAKSVGGPAEEDLDDSTRMQIAVREAAFAAWYLSMGGDEEPATAELSAAMQQSLNNLPDEEFMDSGRIVAAAEYGGWFNIADINQAFRDMDFRDAWRAWMDAWPRIYIPGEDSPWGGKWVNGPDDSAQEWVKEQINALLDAKVHISRLAQAAVYAGFHKSARLYRGLADHELEASHLNPSLSQVLELWRTGYAASAGQDPDETQRQAFFQSVHRVSSAYANDTHGLLNADLFRAAVWAGAYQDPDISTCLPLRTSVFEAAAALPVPPSPE